MQTNCEEMQYVPEITSKDWDKQKKMSPSSVIDYFKTYISSVPRGPVEGTICFDYNVYCVQESFVYFDTKVYLTY